MAMKEKSRNEVRDKEVEESKRCERQAGVNPGGGGRDKTRPIYELRDATACQHLGKLFRRRGRKRRKRRKDACSGFHGWLAKRDG